MTWSELVANIGKWANRPEIEQAIPTFIALTEADIARRLAEAGIAGAEGRSTATLEAGADYAPAPADLARVIRLILTADGARIENVSEQGLEVLKAKGGPAGGKPRVFALVGNEFRYFPAPDADCAVELTYLKKPAALSAGAPSNWVSEGHPDVYLFGGLIQAARHLADDVMAARWAQPFEAAMAGLITAERAKRGEARAGAYRADLPLPVQAGGFNPNPDL